MSVIDDVYFDLMYGDDEIFFARFNDLNAIKKVVSSIDAPVDDWYVVEKCHGEITDYISLVQL